MILLNVTVLNPQKIVYSGKAMSVVVPGEQGVFEVLPLHKNMVSRIISGTLFVDEQGFPVKRGVLKVSHSEVTIIME